MKTKEQAIELNKVHCSPAEIFMKGIPDGYVDLTVTSPPYDDLRSYKGYSFPFEDIANELYRITKKGGVVVWVVGDQTKNGCESGTSFRQALYFMSIGFKLHDTMIYAKELYQPLSHNRYEQEFEYMFVFSKGRPNSFNPIMINCKSAGITYNTKSRSSASVGERNSRLRSYDKNHIVKEYKIKGNVWYYKAGKNHSSKDDIWKHPATFPEILAHDHVISWSNEGDIVFDPFSGSGTTGKMAIINKRQFIGCEISKEYCYLANKRIDRIISSPTLFQK